MSKVKRINVMTPANVLSDALTKADDYESIIVIGIDINGEAMIGYSSQNETELAYAFMKFQSFVSRIINPNDYERIL